jgi:membrane protease YdiL (CAAX protease family)
LTLKKEGDTEESGLNSLASYPVEMAIEERAGMRAFVAGHPYRSAILFWILFFLLNIFGGLAGVSLLDRPVLLLTVASLIVAAGGIIVIVYIGWWGKAGFSSGGTWTDLPLYLLPAGIAFLPFAEGITATGLPAIAAFAAFSIIVAVAEETFFRGLILQSLVPAGILTAVLLSALLFGIPHLLNAVGGIWDPLFTLADTVAAFGIGITFAALVIRTGTIWPPIILHALINFAALISLGSLTVPVQTPTQLAITTAAGLVMAVYGLYLMRAVAGKGKTG